LSSAKIKYPDAEFLTVDQFIATADIKFDTVVGLAIIEHIKSPIDFLNMLKTHLTENGLIVLTTPSLSFEWLLEIGGQLGFFAKDSHAEHQPLFDFDRILQISNGANLTIVEYRRFLLFANQLIVLTRKK